MKNFNIAIEKGIRYLEHENVLFYFVAVEFIFKKENLQNGNYKIIYKENNKIFHEQKLKINIDKRKVEVLNSHEDPLIESDEHFFVCGQLTEDILKTNKINNEVQCLFYIDDILLREEFIDKNVLDYLFSFDNWNSKLLDNEIYTEKDCVVRMHLGKKNKEYKEEEFSLLSNHKISFKKYLELYDYVAVQCSYDIEYDLEEKHVLKGLKGICNSDYIEEHNITYYPIIPFSKKYANKSETPYLLINSLSEILNFYDNNQEYVNKTFEMDEKFLLKFYLENRTTAVGKIYSSLNSKKNHLESMCCELCQEKSKCLQLIPSGLSESLFKKNLLVESFENCSINKIIKKLKE